MAKIKLCSSVSSSWTEMVNSVYEIRPQRVMLVVVIKTIIQSKITSTTTIIITTRSRNS